MAQSEFTIYKYIKLERSWRYCRAVFYSNGKIKPNRCIVGGKEEEHPEGAYYLIPHEAVDCRWRRCPGSTTPEERATRRGRVQEAAWDGSDAEDDRRTGLGQDSVDGGS